MGYNIQPPGGSSENTDVMMSAVIWAEFEAAKRCGNFREVYEDFTSFDLTTAISSNAGRYPGGVRSYEDSTVTFTQTAEKDGILKYTGDTNDNNEAWMQWGGATGAPFVIDNTDAKTLRFETRMKSSTITDTKLNAFVGLAEEGSAAADFINDAGTDFADKDFIGFWWPEVDGDVIRFIYQISGQAFVTPLTSVDVPAADTYVKLGFVWNPEWEAARRLRVYVNGVEQTTYVTATNVAAATFPLGQEMSPILGVKQATGASNPVYWDWIRCGQLKVGA